MNNDEKMQAAAELALFIGQKLVEISKGPQYGFGPPRLTAEEAKTAINAVNNLAKLSPCNDEQIELVNKIAELAKCFVDYVENQGRR